VAGSGRERILAIDVVRGLAVVGMLLVNNAGIPAAMPQALRHAPWQGLTLADQVFPLFLFTVGASLPFSQRAQRPGAVLRRVVMLFLLGSLLVSAKQYRLAPSTGVLQQIAGAYLLAWALLRLPRRAQLPAAASCWPGCGRRLPSCQPLGCGQGHGRRAATWPSSLIAWSSASPPSMACW
jgi:predicted acyltransferase